MSSFATMAAIRFGYGRRPGETPPDSVDALILQVERGVGETSLFPFEGIAERRRRFAIYRTVEADTRKAREAGTLAMIGESSINPYSTALKNALYRDRHRKVEQAVVSQNGFFERLFRSDAGGHGHGPVVRHDPR
ncbi:hypothetical protein [Shinella kummerowiae]|jgi:hypothetical protein|uniref:hypothetical protein n=1 Tax=Shinella kummerowiae TaxID=417745 RepID=UPI001FE60384|nr:hypothetical protein [Shinella kummerowiae]